MVATVGPSRFSRGREGLIVVISRAEGRKSGQPGARTARSLTTNSSFPSHRLLREPSSLLSQNPRGGNDFHAHVIPFSSVRTEQSSSGSPAGGAFYGQLICGRAAFSPCRRPSAALRFPPLMTVTVKQATSRTEVRVRRRNETTENAVRDPAGLRAPGLGHRAHLRSSWGPRSAAVAKKTSDDMAGRRHPEPQREPEPRAEAPSRPFMRQRGRSSSGSSADRARRRARPGSSCCPERFGKSDAAATHLRRARGRADAGASNDGEPFRPERRSTSPRRRRHRGPARLPGLRQRRGHAGPTPSPCPIDARRRPRRRRCTPSTPTTPSTGRCPVGFYGQRAVLYLMDAATERFVLQPEGMGERDAGHCEPGGLLPGQQRRRSAQPLQLVAGGVAREDVGHVRRTR